ncbi:fused MFS/spermidine synthase [Yoonia sp. BS5-3]|uniref:Fused MFS/spermidine synthase n=1 Tax=Yoonia phaeophyticola TaxID=3137369 RepID=A0ABZ2VBL1_9RHOB
MRFWTTIGLILVLSIVGLTYEIAAGRVLAPFFGTSLVTWTAVIATVLAGFALGNAIGGFIAERPKAAAALAIRKALIATAVLMALSPTILAVIYGIGLRGTGGMFLAVLITFFPASVLVSLPSPFLAKLAVEARPGRAGSSLGIVLAAGSVGAIAGAIIAGFVALPLIGSAMTFSGCGAATLICAFFVRVEAPDKPETLAQSPAPAVLTGALIAASLTTGPVCTYESGLSCIDVQRRDNEIRLYADRTTQAAEQIGADTPAQALALAYTQLLWARMDRDLGPAPSVLFIGGGGFSLPTTLLQTRPEAQAVAVEIDPLVTHVVQQRLPQAGAMIAQFGTIRDGGDAAGQGVGARYQIVHADGRVFINETTRRFDAVVMDAFSSASVPAHLTTVETYARLRQITDGPIYVNLIDAPDGRLARSTYAILQKQYPHVQAIRGPISGRGYANIVLAAGQKPFAPLDALPEDYRPVEIAPGRMFTDDRGWVGHR